MKRLLVATHNIHKIKEIELFLSDIPIQIMSLVDLGINLKVEETAQSFESNALKKAPEKTNKPSKNKRIIHSNNLGKTSTLSPDKSI